MANDNQNQVLDEQVAVTDEKSVKRVRKAKPKASESGFIRPRPPRLK